MSLIARFGLFKPLPFKPNTLHVRLYVHFTQKYRQTIRTGKKGIYLKQLAPPRAEKGRRLGLRVRVLAREQKKWRPRWRLCAKVASCCFVSFLSNVNFIRSTFSPLYFRHWEHICKGLQPPPSFTGATAVLRQGVRGSLVSVCENTYTSMPVMANAYERAYATEMKLVFFEICTRYFKTFFAWLAVVTNS